MKNLILCLALLSAAVFTACQENPLMDNPQYDVNQNNSISKTTSAYNTLKLDELLVDPRQGLGYQQYYTLTGSLEYTLKYRPDHTIQLPEFQNTTLKLKINARLIPQTAQDKLPAYSIIAESFDRFNIPTNGSRTILMKKTYKINGFKKVYLSCVYEVGISSVSIKEIKLCFAAITPHSFVSQY